jgi:hypothetical protein
MRADYFKEIEITPTGPVGAKAFRQDLPAWNDHEYASNSAPVVVEYLPGAAYSIALAPFSSDHREVGWHNDL